MISKKKKPSVPKSIWVIMAILCLYLLFAPLGPEIRYQVFGPQTISSASIKSPIDSSIGTVQGIQTTETSDQQGIKHNKSNKIITIPKIGVVGSVLQGDSESVLDNGFWHRPNSGSPTSGGNTVITGHRYKYLSGNNTFYHLDKLEVGDIISLHWENKEYTYKVDDTFQVGPNDTYIEDPTNQDILTLYTCGRLFSTKNRLGVKAKLMGIKTVFANQL